MRYTLKQAAEAAGKSKPTILRAIQSGRISAIRHNLTRNWLIEAAELHRVYPLHAKEEVLIHETVNETVWLKREIEQKNETIRLLQEIQERERSLLESSIDDLRQRLDRESEERRRLSAQVTALLTDQSKKEAPQEKEESVPDNTTRPSYKLFPWL